MKVLSIGRDKDAKIFEPESAVATRNIEYGKKLGEVHVIVFALKSAGLTETKLSNEVTVYPTNSLSRWLYIFDAIHLGKKIIVDKKFVRGDSVITAQDPFECGYVAWRIAKALRLPLHLQIHTDFLSPYFKTSLLQRMRVWCGKFLVPKAAGVRVVSERIAHSILETNVHLKHPLQVLPIRIDAESVEKFPRIDLHSQFPDFKFTILMASRLTKEKRIPDALQAFKRVHEHYPFAGLLIVGEGPQKTALQKTAMALGISDNVVFLGFRDDLPSLMKSASMFLSTSEYEGYGMSLIEAGLSGCPIVSTDVGVSGSILKDGLNASICPVGDIDCFFSKIVTLLSDNAQRGIFTGRLQSDIRTAIVPKEEYIAEYVKGLEEIKGMI